MAVLENIIILQLSASDVLLRMKINRISTPDTHTKIDSSDYFFSIPFLLSPLIFSQFVLATVLFVWQKCRVKKKRSNNKKKNKNRTFHRVSRARICQGRDRENIELLLAKGEAEHKLMIASNKLQPVIWNRMYTLILLMTAIYQKRIHSCRITDSTPSSFHRLPHESDKVIY